MTRLLLHLQNKSWAILFYAILEQLVTTVVSYENITLVLYPSGLKPHSEVLGFSSPIRVMVVTLDERV